MNNRRIFSIWHKWGFAAKHGCGMGTALKDERPFSSDRVKQEIREIVSGSLSDAAVDSYLAQHAPYSDEAYLTDLFNEMYRAYGRGTPEQNIRYLEKSLVFRLGYYVFKESLQTISDLSGKSAQQLYDLLPESSQTSLLFIAAFVEHDPESPLKQLCEPPVQMNREILQYMHRDYSGAGFTSFSFNEIIYDLARQIKKILPSRKIRNLTHDSQIDLFRSFNAAAILEVDTLDTVNFRHHFYKNMSPHPAIKEYHRMRIAGLQDEVWKRENNVELVDRILDGIDYYEFMQPDERIEFAQRYAHLLAMSYDIDTPQWGKTKGVAASYTYPDVDKMIGRINYGLALNEDWSELLASVNHEMSHAIDIMLSRCANPAVHEKLSADLQKKYPPIRPANPLYKSAALFSYTDVFNEYGMYVSSNDDVPDARRKYAAQPNEKMAVLTEYYAHSSVLPALQAMAILRKPSLWKRKMAKTVSDLVSELSTHLEENPVSALAEMLSPLKKMEAVASDKSGKEYFDGLAHLTRKVPESYEMDAGAEEVLQDKIRHMMEKIMTTQFALHTAQTYGHGWGEVRPTESNKKRQRGRAEIPAILQYSA